MKIKGVIEGLKFFLIKKKSDSKNSKNISRTFSGVVGSVGSVHFRIVPWSQDLQAPSCVVGLTTGF